LTQVNVGENFVAETQPRGVVRRAFMNLSIDERSSRLPSGALLGPIACRSRRRGRLSAVGRQFAR
jgi:hypothetical protein